MLKSTRVALDATFGNADPWFVELLLDEGVELDDGGTDNPDLTSVNAAVTVYNVTDNGDADPEKPYEQGSTALSTTMRLNANVGQALINQIVAVTQSGFAQADEEGNMPAVAKVPDDLIENKAAALISARNDNVNIPELTGLYEDDSEPEGGAEDSEGDQDEDEEQHLDE